MCWCDGLGPKEPSLESGLNVPRVTDWNQKMIAMNPKEKSLERRGSQGGLGPRAQRPETELIHKSKAIYYMLSVTSWTRRRPQPLFPKGGKGKEIVVMVNMYSMTEGNETKMVKVENVFPMDRNDFRNTNTPVSNELVVKRNEQSKRHFSEERR